MDEELIISDYLDKKLHSQHLRPSAECSGPIENENLAGGILKSVLDCACLLGSWSSTGTYYIGHLCSVYWDGEESWFSARILNYDEVTKKHFLYYDLDDTSEWVDLIKEPCIICTELVLAKWGTQIWPAMRYFVNPNAVPFMKVLSKSKIKTGLFIAEYCS